MYEGKIVFAQLMEHLPLHTLRRCIERFGGDRSVKGFSCHDQFRCMAFAQLTYRDSLRDTVTCLNAQSAKLYHIGHSRRRASLDVRRRQREARLAALSGVRPGADRASSTALCQRAARRRARQRRLCARHHHHRSVPLAVSVGAIPGHQGGDQTAHDAGFARQYPALGAHRRRQVLRHRHPRRARRRARRHLHHGPRLPRLRASASPDRGRRLLRRTRMAQAWLAPPRIAPRGPSNETRL